LKCWWKKNGCLCNKFLWQISTCVQLSGQWYELLGCPINYPFIGVLTGRYKIQMFALDLRMNLALKFGHMTWHFQLNSIKFVHKQPRWLEWIPIHLLLTVYPSQWLLIFPSVVMQIVFDCCQRENIQFGFSNCLYFCIEF